MEEVDSLSLHLARDPRCVCGLDVCFAAVLDQLAVPRRIGNTGGSHASQVLRSAHCHLGDQVCIAAPFAPLYSCHPVQ